MRNGKRTWVVIALIAAGIVAGCGNNEKDGDSDKKGDGKSVSKVNRPVPPKTPGPKDVALAIWRAVEKGDEKATIAHHDVSPDDKAFLMQGTQVMSTMTAFARAGIKAYGEEAWTAAATKAEMAHLAQPPMPSLAGAETRVQCTIEGDKATCTLEGIPEPLVLVRKGGAWLGAVKDLPPKDQRAEAMKEMSVMVRAMRSVTGKIGQPGVKADQIFQDFAQAMGKALQDS